jgi:hypothetical protein
MIRKSGYRFSSTPDISRIYFRTGISRGDHSNPDLPPRLGRDYGVPQDSRDERSIELLGIEVALIIRAAQPSGDRRYMDASFCRKEPKHAHAFTPENAAMPLIDHQAARLLGRIRFNCDELRNITASAVSYRQTSLRLT